MTPFTMRYLETQINSPTDSSVADSIHSDSLTVVVAAADSAAAVVAAVADRRKQDLCKLRLALAYHQVVMVVEEESPASYSGNPAGTSVAKASVVEEVSKLVEGRNSEPLLED